jgi:hypothetical protein
MFESPKTPTISEAYVTDQPVKNSYDKFDNVRREHVLIGGGLKMAAYRARDPETGEFSSLQFHATFNNTVLALMSEESAKLFSLFVDQTMKGESMLPVAEAT